MTDALLIVIFLLTGTYGYWIMDRVDRFLNEHVKGEEEEADEQQQK
ncbi:MAG: hypothetical protein J6Y48_10240 [Clostridia bacterium]|jgi:hypothetical protein|nr:hypothetical protein [Clostridia bacterium]MBR0408334.1 hypothetical protein [Clostridia bacterium]MBR3016769.1 hypothetical protein [Clostridia bacterium]MBR3741406.1 hypothetical protein [Clostridia bacterium]